MFYYIIKRLKLKNQINIKFILLLSNYSDEIMLMSVCQKVRNYVVGYLTGYWKCPDIQPNPNDYEKFSKLFLLLYHTMGGRCLKEEITGKHKVWYWLFFYEGKNPEMYDNLFSKDYTIFWAFFCYNPIHFDKLHWQIHRDDK